MRTKGSYRFEAYYKLEKYDDRKCCWTPIQKPFPSFTDADKARPKGKTRVMRVEGKRFEEVKS